MTKSEEELEAILGLIKRVMVDCIGDSNNIDEKNLLHFTNYNLDFKELSEAIQAHTATVAAEAARKARIDELKYIVRNSHIELMDPRKPFHWGPDTWTQQVPVIPRMVIDDRLATLNNTQSEKGTE